ncbi:adhesion G protein-coupled receptor E2-like [Mytilus californianus]|uniref:adhesion G protein-coupled receptor E2-like n=1 Tax=Mytilus californianus TaxID=6549 RepID=UPI0022459979|nr:adhesion G protein-coupled receptor E2-like [Mytilus californianus]
MKKEILIQLGRQLNRTIVPFLERMILKVNTTCSSDVNFIGPYLHISVFLKLFVNVVINRKEIETKLLQFQEKQFSFEHYCFRLNKMLNCMIKCNVKYDNGSLYLPIDVPFRKFDITKCYLETKRMIPESQRYIHSHISALLECPQIELDKTEVTIDEYNLLNVPQYSTVLDYHNFYLTRSDLNPRICVSTFKSMMFASSEMSVLQIIILIFTIVSLLCLFLTFITYCLFEQLRTLPGKNNMCLVIALFFAMAFLEFGLNKTHVITLCIVLVGFIHYFWLCTFCCLNVCSFHMYCTFKRNFVYRQRSKSEERKRLLLYILYSFGVPAIIIIMNILFTNFLNVKQLYGYGGKMCFISERLSFIITFIVPITIMCLLNVFFFIYSAHSIATTPKLKNDDSYQHNSVNLAVYIKLFTITGSSWIIQIIDSFLPLSFFSIIVSLLNALQGVYIFVAYICNTRVFILYRSLICNKPVIKSGSESRNVTKNETYLASTKL